MQFQVESATDRGLLAGFCTSRRVFFKATILPVFFSRALYTLPYVPSPIFSSFSYWSMASERQHPTQLRVYLVCAMRKVQVRNDMRSLSEVTSIRIHFKPDLKIYSSTLNLMHGEYSCCMNQHSSQARNLQATSSLLHSFIMARTSRQRVVQLRCQEWHPALRTHVNAVLV